MASTIALLTDFGHSDPFVGIMKGVILSRCPQAKLVDLSHDVAPQAVPIAAFHLRVSAPYFPKGTLFVCVVDPGVGSQRRIVWAKNQAHQFLAPDNGLLSWVENIAPFSEIREVTNRQLFAQVVSRTFHGRDVFAPVAAALSRGLPPSKLGPKIATIERLPFPKIQKDEDGVTGHVLAIDRFGNAITNLQEQDLKPNTQLWFKDLRIGELKSYYGEVESHRPIALTGSFGFIELAVREGSFAQTYNTKVGDPVNASY